MNESKIIQQNINIIKPKDSIIVPLHEYKIYNPEKTGEIVEELKMSMKEKDLYLVEKIIKDSMAWRSFDVRHEEYLLIEAFDMLLRERFGKEILNIEDKELVNFVHEFDLPEQILVEISSMAFHQRNPVLFFKLISAIVENCDDIKDEIIVKRAQHNMATWEAVVNKNFEKSININKDVLKWAKDFGQEVLASKAKFGITATKYSLKSNDKIADYKTVQAELEKMGNIYDAMRAKIEVANCYLKLAKKQTDKKSINVRQENLDHAESIARNVLNIVEEINYPNLEIRSWEVLGNIQIEQGKTQSGKRKLKKANELRELYNYSTKHI